MLSRVGPWPSPRFGDRGCARQMKGVGGGRLGMG